MRIEWTGRRKLIVTAVVFAILIIAVDHLRVRFRVTPGRIEACEKSPIEADVAWLAQGTESVQIFIYGVGEKPKLWLRGGSRGSARTGEWITDGTTLLLTDIAGRPLARRTIEAAACPL